jgi:hypothetical protein
VIFVERITPLRIANASVQQLDRIQVLILGPLRKVPLGVEDVDDNRIIGPADGSAADKTKMKNSLTCWR